MVAFRIENELFLSRPDAEIEGCSRAEEPKGSFTVFFFVFFNLKTLEELKDPNWQIWEAFTSQ